MLLQYTVDYWKQVNHIYNSWKCIIFSYEIIQSERSQIIAHEDCESSGRPSILRFQENTLLLVLK